MNKKMFYAVGVVILILIGVGFFINKKVAENPTGVYAVAIVIRDQVSGGDPEEDRKSSLKRGDALSVRDVDHAWSQTEYISYLILKIRMKKSMSEDLLSPLEKEVNADKAQTKESADEPQNNNEPQMETIVARKFRVDLEKVGFSGDQVISGQPFEDKVFEGEEVVKEK